MRKDAALIVLELLLELAQCGLTLKDSHPCNVTMAPSHPEPRVLLICEK